MNDRLQKWGGLALWALPVYGALLAVSTITHQPDYQTDFPAYARYVTTSQFLLSHLVASIGGAGFGLVGAAGLFIVTDRMAPRLARWGFVMGVHTTVGSHRSVLSQEPDLDHNEPDRHARHRGAPAPPSATRLNSPHPHSGRVSTVAT
jgi:hypothetical protein